MLRDRIKPFSVEKTWGEDLDPRHVLAVTGRAAFVEPLAYADAAGRVYATRLAVDYAEVKRRLDDLEARGVKAMRAVMVEMRDFLAGKVTRGADLSRVIRGLDFSGRVRGDLRRAVRELLRRAWDMGGRDARREMVAGRRGVRGLSDEEGVWRTIRGRKVLIRKGESPTDAVKRDIAEQGKSGAGNGSAGTRKDSAGKTVTVYHGTTADAVKSIKREGVRGPAYVTQSKDLAETYMQRNRSGKQRTALITLSMTKEQFATFKKGFGSEFYSEKAIPASWISDVKMFAAAVTAYAVVLVADQKQNHSEFIAAFDSSFSPIEALRWLDDKAFWITGVTGDKVLNDAKQVLIQGLKTGKGAREMVDALAELFEPYVGKVPGVRAEVVDPYRLETIARTNATDAYNHGRLTEMLDPEVAAGLVGIRYSAVMDERTCFAKGTKVQTLSGLRVIETLRPGDEVISGAGWSRRVRCLKIAFAKDWRNVRFSDGTEIDATATHPVWAIRPEGDRWLELRQLARGDEVGTINLSALRSSVPDVCSEEKEVLLVGLSSGEQGRLLSRAQLPVLRERVQSEENLRRAIRNERAAMLGTVREELQTAGNAAGVHDIHVRGMPQAVLGATVNHSQGWHSPSLLTRMQEASPATSMRDLREGVRDRSGAPSEVLLGLLLPTLGSGDKAGGDGSVAARGARDTVSAGGAARQVFAGLLDRREVGDRGEWRLLAPQSSYGNREVEEASDCGCGASTGDNFSGQERRAVADRSPRGPDHGVRPEPTGKLFVISSEAQPGWRICYDIEVDGDHSYLVGEAGIIAHNTEVCRFLDGKVFHPGDADLEELIPPNHFSCRSIIVPIIAGERFDESEFITDEQVGRAKALADQKFLVAEGAWRAYREAANDEEPAPTRDELAEAEVNAYDQRRREERAEQARALDAISAALATSVGEVGKGLAALAERPVEAKVEVKVEQPATPVPRQRTTTMDIERTGDGKFRVRRVEEE